MVTKVIRESEVEKHLVSRINAIGGMTRKLKWIGRKGAPDRIVILFGRVYFVELKRPGGRLDTLQERESGRIRDHGGTALCFDSKEIIDTWILSLGYVTRI